MLEGEWFEAYPLVFFNAFWNRFDVVKGEDMAPSMERIGFVGVGRMGANMARRLIDVGGVVTAVYDVDTKRAASFSKEIGAECASTPARVAELASVVFTVVIDDAGMRGIFAAEDPTSLLKHAKGRLFVNCATVSPEVHIDVETPLSFRIEVTESRDL